MGPGFFWRSLIPATTQSLLSLWELTSLQSAWQSSGTKGFFPFPWPKLPLWACEVLLLPLNSAVHHSWGGYELNTKALLQDLLPRMFPLSSHPSSHVLTSFGASYSEQSAPSRSALLSPPQGKCCMLHTFHRAGIHPWGSGSSSSWSHYQRWKPFPCASLTGCAVAIASCCYCSFRTASSGNPSKQHRKVEWPISTTHPDHLWTGKCKEKDASSKGAPIKIFFSWYQQPIINQPYGLILIWLLICSPTAWRAAFGCVGGRGEGVWGADWGPHSEGGSGAGADAT